MKDLSKAKVCRDIIRVKFQGMLEVLGSLLALTSIGLQSCKMKARAKVFLVNEETLLK
jgi:hypothetical protein